MNVRVPSLVLGLLLTLVCAVPAVAAPVTVNLRVEGKTATHYEAPVTVDVRTVDGNDGSGAHVCDTTASGGSSAPTAGGALATAPAPFSWKGTWFSSFNDFSVDTIDGETPDFNADATFWGFWVNGAFASAGVCNTKVQDGDRILLAVATGSEKALALTGPSTANQGTPVTVTVTDAGSGAPQAGASVGGALTGADGTASVTFGSTGAQSLKATAPNAIRSNALSVCVHAGDDGTCGTTKPGTTATTPPTSTTPPVTVPVADRTAPKAHLAKLANGAKFTARKGPRELAGTVDADPSGIVAVKLRLTRRSGGRCAYYSGRRETFRATKCGRAFFFKIGDDADWSYLLPQRLGKGRYVLDVVAIDRAGNRDTLERGRSRVVFTVT